MIGWNFSLSPACSSPPGKKEAGNRVSRPSHLPERLDRFCHSQVESALQAYVHRQMPQLSSQLTALRASQNAEPLIHPALCFPQTRSNRPSRRQKEAGRPGPSFRLPSAAPYRNSSAVKRGLLPAGRVSAAHAARSENAPQASRETGSSFHAPPPHVAAWIGGRAYFFNPSSLSRSVLSPKGNPQLVEAPHRAARPRSDLRPRPPRTNRRNRGAPALPRLAAPLPRRTLPNFRWGAASPSQSRRLRFLLFLRPRRIAPAPFPQIPLVSKMNLL